MSSGNRVLACRLTPAEWEMVDELKAAYGTSVGHIVRLAIYNLNHAPMKAIDLSNRRGTSAGRPRKAA